MALRVGQYLLSAKSDLQRLHKNTTFLPQIFPIVLYNGKERWTAPARLSELEENVVDLGEYGVEVHYLPIIENSYSLEHLLKDVNLVSTLFMAEAHYDRHRLVQQLLSLYNENDPAAVSALGNWFRQMTLHKRIPAEDYELLKREYRSKEELQAMIVEAILKEEEKILKEGMQIGETRGVQIGEARGVQIGEARGKLVAQRQTLLRLLTKRFPETLEQIEQFTAYFDQIANFDDLVQLIDYLLLAPTLGAFEEQLQPFLPTSEATQ